MHFSVPGIKGRLLIGRIKTCFFSDAEATVKKRSVLLVWASWLLGFGGNIDAGDLGDSVAILEDFDLEDRELLRTGSLVLGSGSSEAGSFLDLDLDLESFSSSSRFDFLSSFSDFDGDLTGFEESSLLPPLLLESAKILVEKDFSSPEIIDPG